MDVKNTAITTALVGIITYVLLVILYQLTPDFDLSQLAVKLAPSVAWNGMGTFILVLVEIGIFGLYLGGLYAYLYNLIGKK